MNKEKAIQNLIDYIYDIERKNFQEEYSCKENNWLESENDISNFIQDNRKEINHIFTSLYYLSNYENNNSLSIALDIMNDRQVEEFIARTEQGE